MYKQERIKPYNGKGDKGQLVEEMFDNIADNYDTLNPPTVMEYRQRMETQGYQGPCAFSPLFCP